MLMYSGVFSVFQKILTFSARLKVTSEKSVSIRFVSMVIESASFLNNATISIYFSLFE